MNKIILSVLLIFAVLPLSAQTFDSFMENVSLHHPDINASRHLLSADEAESITDLRPEDPRISVGYFPGNEPSPGDKITWGISQSFDFPTRYARIKALKLSNLELARMEYSYTYLQIMSEARATAIEFLNQRDTKQVMLKRLETMNNLEDAYSSILARGETTIIEYNKIRIKKIELISEITELNNKMMLLKTRLDFMSGGQSNDLTDLSYPQLEKPDLETLIANFKSSHPGFIIPTLRKNAADMTVRVSKSENMPAFEIGYSSEIVADQRFTGPSLGVRVPLWNKRGKVNKSIADSDYQLKRAESDILLLESMYSGYLRSYISTEGNIDLVSEALKNADNLKLLDRALRSGEIALTEYLLELGSIYELEDMYLVLQKNKYILLSRLNELDFLLN